MTTRIAVLGSTGSIGRQTLEAVAGLGPDWEITTVAANSNVTEVAAQAASLRCRAVAMFNDGAATELKRVGAPGCRILSGPGGLVELASDPEVDIVVVAVVGTAGIAPTIAALRAGKRVALANKETLVAAGEPVMAAMRQGRGRIIPVDSEHSAIFQCLAGQPSDALESITLTASGGPFRNMTLAELEQVTVEMALRHPTWDMGAKVTIDSSTLMNKGLEVIEAHWLFGLEYDRIYVLVHPASVVHSMIHLVDGSILAQLGPPDMRLPIQYALTYPDRLSNRFGRLNLAEQGTLAFYPPDTGRFPALALAYEAGRAGGTAPAVLNAANEVAVDAFRRGILGYTDIARIVEETLGKHINSRSPGLEAIMDADRSARETARAVIRRRSA